MERLTKLVVNCATGITQEIELTDEEMLEVQMNTIESEKRRAEAKAKEEAKTAAKASALAKLQELGLTEDEAAAIIG